MIARKEISKKIRKMLKSEFSDCKFSVTTKSINITVALMAAPATPFASLECIGSHYDQYPQTHAGEYQQLNHYHIERDWQDRWSSNCIHLTEKTAKMFIRITEFVDGYNYDRSDIQRDYFDVGFYFHIAIGRWNKPFVIK